MKLRKLHIDEYKMFKDFDISFVDENDEALPIVILAGVNGSGKTTLLEYLLEVQASVEFEDDSGQIVSDLFESSQDIEIQDLDGNFMSRSLGADSTDRYFAYTNGVVYFPSGLDDLSKVAEEFVKTFYFFLKEKDYRSSEITKHFHKYMEDIFDDLDLGLKYSHLDKDDNVWFSNEKNEEYYYTAKKNNNEDKNIFTIDKLSTGEKTLLSKVLYLYFKDYKDKVILIDEPELSLHPSWQNKILSVYEKLAKKNNCQIIIATHSPHIIGSAKPEYLRVLKKAEDAIEVVQYTQSYGLKFSQILTDIMGVDYLRTPEVAKKLEGIKAMIINNAYDSDTFQSDWKVLEEVLGKNNLDLKLLKLEIASRRKNASNN